MKTVRVYIETTIHGPSVRDGKYAAALVFTKQNGEVKDLFIQGEEAETTYNRSVLLAMIQANNPEKWRRAEWKRSAGKEVQNRELWQLFLQEKDKHKVEVVWEKDSEYKQTLQAFMEGDEI